MVAGAVGPDRTGATSVTAAGRATLFLVMAWLLAAVALLAIQGMLGAYLLAVGRCDPNRARAPGAGPLASRPLLLRPADPATAARALPGGR